MHRLLTRKRWGAVVLINMLVIVIVSGMGIVVLPKTHAASNTYPVMNTDEYPPDGVYFRSAPDWNQAIRITGFGVYKGESVYLSCWKNGTNVPRRDGGSNTIWYKADNVTRPTVNGAANTGWINAHFVNDGTGPGQVAPNVPNCDSPNPPPEPLPRGGGIYFQPRWSNGDPYPPDAVLTIQKDQWSHSTIPPKSKVDCPTDRVDDRVPDIRNGQQVTTMGAWSVARLAPVYLIEEKFNLAKRFNFIILYDPGSYANYYDKKGCDQFFDESGDLAKWLSASTADNPHVLMILAGHDTYDPNWLGHGNYEGIRHKLFPKISGKSIANQVYVCSYIHMKHPDIMWNFRDLMQQGLTTTCPGGAIAWHP